jgi:hypothetical protein
MPTLSLLALGIFYAVLGLAALLFLDSAFGVVAGVWFVLSAWMPIHVSLMYKDAVPTDPEANPLQNIRAEPVEAVARYDVQLSRPAPLGSAASRRSVARSGHSKARRVASGT